MSHSDTRTNIPGTSPYEPIIGFSRAVRIGNHIHVSGTGPVGADEGDIARQTEQTLNIIATALKNAGSSIDHVYRTRLYLTHAEDWEAAGRVHGKFFSGVRPAATMVVVAALLNPSWRIEIEAGRIHPRIVPYPRLESPHAKIHCGLSTQSQAVLINGIFAILTPVGLLSHWRIAALHRILIIDMSKLSIRDLDLTNKRVFIRVDFNVPLKDGVITDDTRIRETIPTIEYALRHKAKVILASHLGRPKGQARRLYEPPPRRRPPPSPPRPCHRPGRERSLLS